MSEEEKKAIELLTELRGLYEATAEDHKFRGTLSIQVDEDDSDAIATILNLIEKQQEEIEELKEAIKERETRLQEEINENCKLKTELYGNSISKDKIRDKILELEEIKNAFQNDEWKREYNYKIEPLKELLDEK